MDNDLQNEFAATLSTQELTAENLRGRQSVRATFRLSPEVIELLSIAANQLGLKQKSLFDQLVEDRQNLARMAAEATNSRPDGQQRHQKTYVLSRSSVVSLDQVAREHRMSRDVLVEISINRLLPVITLEQEKQKKKAVILAEMERYQKQGRVLLEKVGELLGGDDPVFRKFEAMVVQGGRAVDEIRDQVERGKEMERYL